MVCPRNTRERVKSSGAFFPRHRVPMDALARSKSATSCRPPRACLPAIPLIVRPSVSGLFGVSDNGAISLNAVAIFQRRVERHPLTPESDVFNVSIVTEPRSNQRLP